MYIHAFSHNIDPTELQKFKLKNCNVVIDGQNYFYNSYKKFGLPYEFGCEANRFAQCLKDHLSMFTNSNVTCYIIFKGGDNKDPCTITKESFNGVDFNLGEESKKIVLPVFMKKVYKEVLKELGIKYVICQRKSKQQCIAMAQTLKCPIISFDIEFCFSGVPYIPHNTMKYDAQEKSISCGIFVYEDFKNKNNLTNEMIAIFIALLDQEIVDKFPENTFEPIFRELKLPLSSFWRNEKLLKLISMMGLQKTYSKIYKHLTTPERTQFEELVTEIQTFICRTEKPGIPVDYLLNNGNKMIVFENDPNWFEKGIALGHIDINYINLYEWEAISGSWCIEDNEAEDAMLICTDIIAYAYNLMTNYQKSVFKLCSSLVENGEKKITHVNLKDSIPLYKTENVPFINGWDDLKCLRLFEHFMLQSIPGLTFEILQRLPEDAKLLILTLVYFSSRKNDVKLQEIYSILLSYVMLGVVFEKVGNGNRHDGLTGRPDGDAVIDKSLVTLSDCASADEVLQEFFHLNKEELQMIFDRKLIHTFVQFQHCLYHVNILNDLCGRPFEPTVYHKTYNATFVYKFFYSIRSLSRNEVASYIKNLLAPAPTVLAFLNGLMETYDQVVSS